MGATNLPWAIDEAVLSRFENTVYLGLPDKKARKNLIKKELEKRSSQKLEKEQLKKIVQNTENYSYRDFKKLFKDLNISIRRSMSTEQITKLKKGHLFPIKFENLDLAIKNRGAISTNEKIERYLKFSPQINLNKTQIDSDSSSEEGHGLYCLKSITQLRLIYFFNEI